MQRIYQNFLFIAFLSISQLATAQIDSTPVSVNPQLIEIFNNRPKEYTIAGISVTGNQSFDPNLIISISGLAVGDKVTIPGTDAFGKAISKLWRQNLIADVEVNLINLEGNNLYIELAITERPRLADVQFSGIKKSEKEDLEAKIGLSKDKVVTDNMKISALDAIKKFYSEKSYRNATVTMQEKTAPGMQNAVLLLFNINKGNKVKVNSINIAGNEDVTDSKIKKQMKGTKEKSRFSLNPAKYSSPYNDSAKTITFKEYLKDYGFLSLSKTKDAIDPYFRFKLFSSSKFNEQKYDEDREKILDYYNAEGFRDAVIVDHKEIPNTKGDLDIHIKLSEGRKYYFGDIN